MNIALLTDFGTKDYFVGAMQGVIFSINENAKIIDITHEIEPQNIRAASFTLRACYKNFPEKTIFVAVVDPGVGSDRRAILVETEVYFFIAPDNGLLSFVFNETENFRVFEITNENYVNQPVSKTFHGRDIFAPIAAYVSKGILASEFGREISDFKKLSESKPQKLSENELQAEIIYSDRFGNLITNLTTEDLSHSFSIEIKNHRISKLRNYFAESEMNEIFMIFGSAGFLEIAAYQNSAKKILNAEIGDKIKVIYKN
ncbi:S-adenosyl-l-methionine hydroxide adenosyltransferase family protein [soil metagenome]